MSNDATSKTSFLAEQRNLHKKELAEDYVPMSNDELNEVFELDQKLILPFQLRKRKKAHCLTPEIKHHKFDRDMLATAIIASAEGESIQFYGAPGTGKTSFAKQFHARLNRPLKLINGGPGLDEDILIGRSTPVNGEQGISLKDYVGWLLYGLKYGIPVCIDEFNLVDDRVWYACNDILAGEELIPIKHLVIDPDISPEELSNGAGGVIVRHPLFRFWSTANEKGGSEATKSRITYIKVSYLNKDEEVAILQQFLKSHPIVAALGNTSDQERRIKSLQLESMVEFANQIRAMYSGEHFNSKNSKQTAASTQGISQTVDLRWLKRWASKTLFFNSLDHGFAKGMLSSFEGGNALTAAEIFNDVFNRKLDLSQPVFSEAASSVA